VAAQLSFSLYTHVLALGVSYSLHKKTQSNLDKDYVFFTEGVQQQTSGSARERPQKIAQARARQ
jgi:hypothetical protein